MKTIPLTRGKEAIVDDADFDYLNQWKWFCSTKGYAVRTVNTETAHHTVYMHKEVLRLGSGEFADHRNRNPLDNRRENLRRCSKSQNSMNRARTIKNRSGYKGVYWSGKSPANPWAAKLQAYKRPVYIGLFPTAEMAALAYNEAALEHHGEFAYQNVIPN